MQNKAFVIAEALFFLLFWLEKFIRARYNIVV